MLEKQNIELPEKYYADYFNFLLDFVKDKYAHILDEKEWRFLRKFYALSEDAQCLFIRFTNRKGLFFKTNKLNYPELATIPKLLDELEKRGFIESLQEKHSLYLNDLLHLSTKVDLLKLCQNQSLKNLTKGEIIDWIGSAIDGQQVLQDLRNLHPIIKLNYEFEVTFLKFLFFGNRYMDMTEFVVRDLGYVQYFKQHDDALVALFENRKDADDKWMVSDQVALFEELKKSESPEAVYDWFFTFNENIKELSKIAQPSLERLSLKIARYLERNKALDLAIELYKKISFPEASERHIRCLFKLKHKNEALALCEEIMVTSKNADEILFARDFSGRMLKNNPRKKKLTTEKLHEAEKIHIPSLFKGQVELGTINYYLENGKHAVFAENYLWRGLFGLVFWDIIFDPSLLAFHHPFQRRPSDLHLPDFYEKRKNSIHTHLENFSTTEELLLFMGKKYLMHENTANPFVIWEEGMWESIKIASGFIPLNLLKEILIHISKDIVENSRGFPDLFVWDENDYEFIEVKSPTDNLSNRQLYWLNYFEEKGINARVLRVFFLD